jgi:hypothetical protein
MRDTASQVAPMRHITPTLTQPAFTSGSDETYYPDLVTIIELLGIHIQYTLYVQFQEM